MTRYASGMAEEKKMCDEGITKPKAGA